MLNLLLARFGLAVALVVIVVVLFILLVLLLIFFGLLRSGLCFRRCAVRLALFCCTRRRATQRHVRIRVRGLLLLGQDLCDSLLGRFWLAQRSVRVARLLIVVLGRRSLERQRRLVSLCLLCLSVCAMQDLNQPANSLCFRSGTRSDPPTRGASSSLLSDDSILTRFGAPAGARPLCELWDGPIGAPVSALMMSMSARRMSRGCSSLYACLDPNSPPTLSGGVAAQ